MSDRHLPRPRRPARAHEPPHHDDLLPVDPDLAPDDPGEPSRSHRPTAHVRRSAQRATLAAIALGGFLGSLARYGVTRAWPAPPGHLPWATFVINTSGALFLGLVLTVILEGPRRPPWARPFLCVGFTGAWTTMSALALDTDLLVQRGHPATALLDVGLSVLAGLTAARTGIEAGRRVAARRARWRSR